MAEKEQPPESDVNEPQSPAPPKRSPGGWEGQVGAPRDRGHHAVRGARALDLTRR
jgi:hypothetical protein